MMQKIRSYFANNNYMTRTEGATAVEYGLIAAFITLVIVVGIAAFGEALNEFFFATLPGVLSG